MIREGRPLMFFDVDAVGAAIFAALCAAAAFAVAVPLFSDLREAADLAVRLETAQRGREYVSRLLQDTRREVAWLSETVERCTAVVPSPQALPELTSRIADVAQQNSLALQRVTPGPLRPSGELMAAEVQVAARGASADIVRFLDKISREYGSIDVQQLSITAGGPNAACALQCTLRLHVLPNARKQDAPSGPAPRAQAAARGGA